MDALDVNEILERAIAILNDDALLAELIVSDAKHKKLRIDLTIRKVISSVTHVVVLITWIGIV